MEPDSLSDEIQEPAQSRPWFPIAWGVLLIVVGVWSTVSGPVAVLVPWWFWSISPDTVEVLVALLFTVIALTVVLAGITLARRSPLAIFALYAVLGWGVALAAGTAIAGRPLAVSATMLLVPALLSVPGLLYVYRARPQFVLRSKRSK
jgi:hypothetical protein